jgi:hypothetical protein
MPRKSLLIDPSILRGIDQQKYANCPALCAKPRQDMGWLTRSASISDCVANRGDHVTTAKR